MVYHQLSISFDEIWLQVSIRTATTYYFHHQVAALPLMVMQYEKRTGLPENLASSHMGGIYSSYFFLGSFLGPLAGGYVIDITSYGFICTICGILLLVSFQIMMGLQLAKKQFLNP